MAMTRQDINLILSLVSQMLAEQRVYVGEHGVAVAGTWSAVDNASSQIEASTVEVTSGKTAAIIGDDGDTGLAKPRVAVGTMAPGDQYGVIGNERCIMVPTETGPLLIFQHGADDTPGAPPGERWTTHYDPKQAGAATPKYVINAYRKFTNDGKVAGDNKGGYRVLVGGYGTFQTTNGHTIALDDTGKQITITTAGGQSIVMDDTTGSIQLQGSGNASGDALVRESDLQTALNNMATAVQTWAEANVKSTATGSGWTGAAPTPPTATASSKSFTA